MEEGMQTHQEPLDFLERHLAQRNSKALTPNLRLWWGGRFFTEGRPRKQEVGGDGWDSGPSLVF